MIDFPFCINAYIHQFELNFRTAKKTYFQLTFGHDAQARFDLLQSIRNILRKLKLTLLWVRNPSLSVYFRVPYSISPPPVRSIQQLIPAFGIQNLTGCIRNRIGTCRVINEVNWPVSTGITIMH